MRKKRLIRIKIHNIKWCLQIPIEHFHHIMFYFESRVLDHQLNWIFLQVSYHFQSPNVEYNFISWEELPAASLQSLEVCLRSLHFFTSDVPNLQFSCVSFQKFVVLVLVIGPLNYSMLGYKSIVLHYLNFIIKFLFFFCFFCQHSVWI
jgi:hypothetical protein